MDRVGRAGKEKIFGTQIEVALAHRKRDLSAFRILVVDDDVLNQELAVLMLEHIGIQSISRANNGLNALKAIEDMPYDLVLMDVRMPEMDGLEATRAIRNQEMRADRNLCPPPASPTRLPIVALTGCARPEDRNACLIAGMDDCLIKPLSLVALAEALENWLPDEPGPGLPSHEFSVSYRAAGIADPQDVATPAGHSLTILLVEDEPAHAGIVRRNLPGFPKAHRLVHVENAQVAMDYLNRKNRYANSLSAPLPDLILLDLHMPEKGAIEVLRQIRDSEALRNISTVVLTTSSSALDLDAARELGATEHLLKPVSFENFTKLLDNWSQTSCAHQSKEWQGPLEVKN